MTSFLLCYQLMSVLKALVYEIFLETFYEKIKRNFFFFTIFYTSYKSGIETFLKWFV